MFNGFTTRFLHNKVCILLSFVSLLCSCLKPSELNFKKKRTNGTLFFLSSLMKQGRNRCLAVCLPRGGRAGERGRAGGGGEKVYGFRSSDVAWMMNVYTLLLVPGKSSTNQQSRHVHFAKLYKVALIVKSSDHNIALTHQEVLPCGGRKRKSKKKINKCKKKSKESK